MMPINRILELRKEKSRDAARSRRGKENYEFYELAKAKIMYINMSVNQTVKSPWDSH